MEIPRNDELVDTGRNLRRAKCLVLAPLLMGDLRLGFRFKLVVCLQQGQG